MVKEIPVSGSDRKALVDDEDYEAAMEIHWACGGVHYKYVQNKHHCVSLQEFVLNRIPLDTFGDDMVDNSPFLRIMFLNGDGFDCRRSNLRLVTARCIARRCSKMKGILGRPCSSKYKGVCWNKRSKKWQVAIRNNGVQLHLGFYNDEAAAARAYDRKARELFGHCARLNFPEEG